MSVTYLKEQMMMTNQLVKPRAIGPVIILAAALALAACSNSLDPPTPPTTEEDVPAGMGSVSVAVTGAGGNPLAPSLSATGAGGSTVAPSLSVIGVADSLAERPQLTVYPGTAGIVYGYVFTNTATSKTAAPLSSTGAEGSKTFVLPVGAYTVTVSAYYPAVAPANLVTSGTSAPFTVMQGGSNPGVGVTLEPVATGPGTGIFTYTITHPMSAAVTGLTFAEYFSGTEQALTGRQNYTGYTGSLSPVTAGYYEFTVILTDSATGKTAGQSEVVHIYQGLTSTADFTFTDADFITAYGISLDPAGTYTFADAATGYSARTALSVTVSNTNYLPTGALRAELEGPSKDDFVLSKTEISSIAVGGTSAFTVAPKTGLALGAYTASVIVSGGNGMIAGFDVSFTVIPTPVYSISLNQSGAYTYLTATAGYGAQTAKDVTVSNTGNQETGALTAYLSGANSTSFALSTNSISSIAPGGTGSFTAAPKTGLAVGTYTATVSVIGNNSIGAGFDVSFTVNPKPVTGVSLNKSSFSLVNGKSERLTATIVPANATNQALSWSSNDGSVATVSNGIVIAKGTGNAVITVTTADGGRTASATVTVTPAAPSDVAKDFLFEQSRHSSRELLFAYPDSGFTKAVYYTGYVDNQIIAYDWTLHDGSPRTLAFSTTQMNETSVTDTMMNSVETGLSASVTAKVTAGVPFLKAELSTTIGTTYTELWEYQTTETVTNKLETFVGNTYTLDGRPSGYYLNASLACVDYYVVVSIDPAGNVVERKVYPGVVGVPSVPALFYAGTTNPISHGELIISSDKKLDIHFDVELDEVREKMVDLPQTEFSWIDDRPDFEVRNWSDALLGIGNYDVKLSDNINLGSGFEYNKLRDIGFTTVTITVDTDICETVETWVDVAILKSNGDPIGVPQTFNPDGNDVSNKWKEHYVSFSRNISLADISDGKFTIRYSARGKHENKYVVGTARVTVNIHSPAVW